METFDENLNKTGYKYDWVGNLLWVKEYIDQSYYLTEYEYDEFGNLLKAKDAKGNTTSYLYGMFGIERILYPNNTEETFTYDCIGNVIEKTSGDRVIHYQYNSASQLVRVEYPDSFVSFMYDENGNRITMEDPYSSAVYVYDSRNRLVSETKTIDSIDQNYRHQNYRQYEQISYQNNILTDYLYDLRGRPTQIKTAKNGSDLLNLTYTYDATGNILQMKNVDSNELIKEEWDYTYDSLNRLKTATGGPSGQNYSLTYQYDSTGNRTQLNGTLYTYNEMNELLSSGSTNGSSTFTYDLYGNCTKKEDGTNVWEYTYDCENRLTSVKENGQVVEQYIYDGDGRRIKKSDATSERLYIYSGLNVLYEVNVTTHMDAVYIYGLAGKIAKKVNDIKEYYHTDHLGSTRLVTTEKGEVTEEIQYEPFGEQINATEERYTYNGKERDETGLYYYGARYYDPTIGRFISRDPLTGEKESPQALNRYTYCLNNPLKFIDPSGTKAKTPQEIVEEMFGRMQNVSQKELARIQELMDAGKQLEALKEILELLGFKVTRNDNGTLDVGMSEGGQYVTFTINNDLKNEQGMSLFGCYDTRNNTVSINFSLCTKAGDVALTVLHEMCHATLAGQFGDQEYEHSIIYSVEHSYMTVYKTFLGAEFSEKFVTHIEGSVLFYDRSMRNEAPLPEIMERWLPVLGEVVA